MNVDIIASDLSDNFFYVIADTTGRAALVDPVDGDQAVAFVEARGLELRWVINTHFHHDHIGGNDAVFARFAAARLVAGRRDAERIEAQQTHEVDRRVGGGDVIEVGDVRLDVLDTPGHTPGHISLAGGGHVFSGDTVFVGGAGNCNFGGDPGVLFETFRDVLCQPSDDDVFYPGHDYSVRNLEFVLFLDPHNARAQSLLEQARGTPADDIFLTTFGEERAYNPFFRYDDAALAERVAGEHPQIFERELQRSATREEAVFRTVRELRNRW